MASSLGINFSGVVTPLLFRFLVFLELAAFLMAFIFIILTFAATSARYHAAEMVLVLHLLTIFGFLRALQLERARTSPFTVRSVAGCTLIVRRTTVEKIRGPFTLGEGAPSHMFQLPTTALPKVRVGMR